MIAGKMLNRLSRDNDLFYELETEGNYFVSYSNTNQMRIKASTEIDKFINLPENFGKQYKISNVQTLEPVDIANGEKIYVNLCVVKT